MMFLEIVARGNAVCSVQWAVGSGQWAEKQKDRAPRFKAIPGSTYCQLPTAHRTLLGDPLSSLLQFLNLTLHQFSFERTHFVQKHDAIAVVGFVQHAAGS